MTSPSSSSAHDNDHDDDDGDDDDDRLTFHGRRIEREEKRKWNAQPIMTL